MDNNFLLISISTQTLVYKNDSTTSGIYSQIYSFTGTTLNRNARAMSPDGLIILQDLNQPNTSSLNILVFDNVTYILAASCDLGTLTSNIRTMSIATVNAGIYKIVISFISSVNYYQLYSANWTFILIQNIKT
jgi:hypothetical protein